MPWNRNSNPFISLVAFIFVAFSNARLYLLINGKWRIPISVCVLLMIILYDLCESSLLLHFFTWRQLMRVSESHTISAHTHSLLTHLFSIARKSTLKEVFKSGSIWWVNSKEMNKWGGCFFPPHLCNANKHSSFLTLARPIHFVPQLANLRFSLEPIRSIKHIS